eukprot:gene18117-20634_t
MNRANQQALFQQTNQGLLSIRQSEVNYYQSLNVAFGTQAALIGGFTYGVFTQNQINYENGYNAEDIIADVYWIISAITIALSVHVILCTMLMQVLGPGLALNGPVGSMARATEGMRLEQQQIIVSFIAMMITFSAATVLSCWVVMSFEASVGCSISFAVAACYWYKYCERIYLRFYWESEDAGWKPRSGSFDPNEEDPAAQTENPLTKANSYMSKQQTKANKKSKNGLFRMVFGTKRTKSTAGEENDQRSRSNSAGSYQPPLMTNITTTNILQRTLTNTSFSSEVPGMPINPNWAATSTSRGVIMEGYLTKRGGNAQKFLNRSEPWERRYFTLTSAGNLYIYKNRHEYRNDHKNPIYTRPLRLSDYYIEVNNFDDEIRESITTESDFVTGKSEGGLQRSLLTVNNITVPDDSEIKPFRFQMTLILREHVDGVVQLNDSGVSARTLPSNKQSRYRDHWVLRCDTEEELQHWVHMMQDLCPSSFRQI